MQLHGVLTILLMGLCTAHGLRCYACATTDPKTCTNTILCPDGFDRCSSSTVNGVLTRLCMTSSVCVAPGSCCEGDLCNGAVVIPTGAMPPAPSTIPPGHSTIPTGQSTTPTGQSATPTGQSTTPTGQSTTPTGQSTTPTGHSTITTGQSTTPTGHSTIPTGHSAVLLLVSSAIITVFL